LSEPVVSRGAGKRGGETTGTPDPHLKRNLVLLTLDGAFFAAGGAFYDSGTILPLFVSTLTDSRLLVGLAGTVRTVGWFLPQLAVANLTGHLRYKSRLVIVNSLLHRVGLLLMAAITYLYAGTQPALALGLFFPLFVLAAMSEGINGVPWTDVVANTIPARYRGRLFAGQQVIGCLLAFFNGFLVRLILLKAAYPDAYVIFFLCTFAGFLLSILSFMGVKEKPALDTKKRQPLRSYLRSLPAAWRGNPRFSQVMLVRFCLGFVFLSYPFLALHARQNLGLDPSAVGLFVSAQMAGSLIGSAIAGRLSDRAGNRTVVILSILTTFLTPATALILTLARATGFPHLATLFYPLVFFFLGAAFSAGFIGFTNYVLDVAPGAERPTYIGLSNTLMAPFAFLSVLGGLLASLAGYELVFAVSLAVAFIGVVRAFRLAEPRDERDLPTERSDKRAGPPALAGRSAWRWPQRDRRAGSANGSG
jgi:MFS family permease